MRPIRLSEEAQRVLIVLRERASDGYTVISRTGLDLQQLESAVSQLLEEGLVSIKGDRFAPGIGESYLFVPPDAKGRAQFLVE